MFLLDTNVLSEPNRPRPEPRVLRWLARVPQDQVFTTARVIAELLVGAAIHDDPIRRAKLTANIDRLLKDQVAGRILPYDLEAARVHARLIVQTRGRTRPEIDLQIAAVAAANRFILVTRNVRDLVDLRLPLLNPWEPVG